MREQAMPESMIFVGGSEHGKRNDVPDQSLAGYEVAGAPLYGPEQESRGVERYRLVKFAGHGIDGGDLVQIRLMVHESLPVQNCTAEVLHALILNVDGSERVPSGPSGRMDAWAPAR